MWTPDNCFKKYIEDPNDQILEFNFPKGVRQYKWKGWGFDRPLPGVTHFRVNF